MCAVDGFRQTPKLFQAHPRALPWRDPSREQWAFFVEGFEPWSRNDS